MRTHTLFHAFGLLALGLPTAASAQRGAEATIYRDVNFRGPAVAVSGATPDLALAWPVTSVRVASGRWQLCSAANYRGNCIVLTANTPNITGRLGPQSRLGSIRPLSGGGGGGDGGGGGAGNNGPSLKGMAAEFYRAPAIRGARIEACARGSASANCAAQTADNFCRNVGWTASARESMETVGRRVYLADVLCSRTGY
jgi:hypothetical protein